MNNCQYQYVIETDESAEEELSEKLIMSGASSISVYREDGSIKLTAIFDKDPETIAELQKINGTVHILDQSRWLNAWKEYYEAVEVSENILILPNGKTKTSYKNYNYIIKCDPGNSFGHGGHPTTKLSLHHLSETLNSMGNSLYQCSLLDAGTGTGLLAILGAMMGCREIDAFDIEEDSLTDAQKNASRNNIDSINFFQKDIFQFNKGKKYDVITANLLTDILLKIPLILKKHLKKNGFLILSGISAQWLNEIENTYHNHGFHVCTVEVSEDWSLLKLTIIS